MITVNIVGPNFLIVICYNISLHDEQAGMIENMFDCCIQLLLEYLHAYCFLAEPQPLDLGFVLGASGQNAPRLFQAEVSFVKSLLPSYSISPLATRIGAITHGASAQVAFELNKYSSESSLKTALDQLKSPVGGSNLGEALQLARTSLFSQENGARAKVQKSLVIFLSEERLLNEPDLKTELQALKSSGVRVVVIAIGDSVDKKLASEIASPNALFFPPKLEELDPYLYPVYIATFEGEIYNLRNLNLGLGPVDHSK